MHWYILRKMQRHMSILQNRFKPKCSSTSLCITFETLELHELQCSFKVNYIKTTSTHCSVMGNYISKLHWTSVVSLETTSKLHRTSVVPWETTSKLRHIIFSGNVIIDYDIYHEISYLVDLHRYFQSHVNSKIILHIMFHEISYFMTSIMISQKKSNMSFSREL